MKAGRSISEIAQEIERQAKAKKDYIADTRRLKLEVKNSGSLMLEGVNGGMPLRPTAHAQLSDSLKIPKPYYDRMLVEEPDLLAANVNRWLERQPAKKLIRTLDDHVRAILSDSYRPLDNLDLAEAALPELEARGIQIESSEITEKRFYLKGITEAISSSVGPLKVPVQTMIRPGHHELLKDDIMWAGIMISNSEIGAGSLRIEALDFRLVCWNGLISSTAIRKAHLGRSSGLDAIEDAREYFRTETRQADDKAFFLKTRDAIGAMFDAAKFESRIGKYREAQAIEIKTEPEEVVELVSKRFGFSEGERGSILKNYIKSDMSTVWGVANAITRAAQDVESYDRSTEMERIGGEVIELPRSAWKQVQTVA